MAQGTKRSKLQEEILRHTRRKENERKEVFGEIMTKNFPELKNNSIQTENSHQSKT